MRSVRPGESTRFRAFGMGSLLAVASACLLLASCAETAYLRERISLQEQTIRKYKADLDQLREYYNTLYTQKVEDNARFEKEIKLRNDEIGRLGSVRSDRERTLAERERQANLRLDETNKENARLLLELRKKDTAIAALKKEVGDLQTVRTQMVKERDDAQSRAESLGREKQATERSLATTQQRLGAVESERDQLKTTLQEREGQIADYKKTVAKLEEDVNAAGKSQGDLTNQLAAIRKQAEEKDAEIARLKNQLASLQGSGKVQDPRLDKAKEAFAKILEQEVKEHGAEVLAAADRVILRIRSDVLFEEATVLLRKSAEARLQQVAEVLGGYEGYQLRVEGHTDNQLVRSMPFPDNLALSSQRADNVTRFLLETGKLPKDIQIRSTGCSYWLPIATNDTLEGRRQNRRVEIVLMHKE